MPAERPGHGGGTVAVMTTTPRRAALTLAGLLLLTTAACSSGHSGDRPAGTRSAASPAAPAASSAKVLLLGDSVAAGEALPLAAAFKAGGVTFQSLAADGGGNVVGPFAAEQWKQLPGEIATARATVVVYQITTYDWGSAQEQQNAYRRLLNAVTGAGGTLVLVTMPPIRPDDFYRPHMADLGHAAAAARNVASSSAGRARFLDAAAVWGSSYARTRNGRTDRSSDGIHTCPQGAARFTHWLLPRLTPSLPRFTPPPATTWATTGWSTSSRFKGC